MRIIKKINNNFALAVDNNLEELIIYGKGVGFPTMPYELKDLSKIERTYYSVDIRNISLFDHISDEIILVSSEIADVCRNQIDTLFNPNMVFTLSDHIAFCVERMEKNIHIQYPMTYDLQQIYAKEFMIAQDAVKLINYRLHTAIPRTEAAGIAINIINNEMTPHKHQEILDAEKIIEHITKIVENAFGISINRNTANYARYATHIHYFLQRLTKGECIESGNSGLLDAMIEQCPKEYSAAVIIVRYLESKFNQNIHKEEMLYLILHINRVCSRENCDQES
ncbi:hypothetical protein C807_02482 [Lachnospiraceae bacterium 28-4]|nr:hypothetical protein C807_02482 [Lachnospiraceae bacterium 28-4]